MGQKVNPIGLRLGINRTWDSRWFADADYAKQLHEDFKIREYLKKKLSIAGIKPRDCRTPGEKSPHYDSFRASRCCHR